MQRNLLQPIRRDLKRKIILITGPRQAGKTTLAKMLTRSYDYVSFDSPEDRLLLRERSWDRSKEIVIFDELHKWKGWKRWLKGLYDTEGIPPGIVVTGSARMDLSRKAGESRAGRYFEFRLHPLDLKEIRTQAKTANLDRAFDRLLELGGFPEPYLKGSKAYYNRWKKTHLDAIIRQDLLDLEQVHEIASIETLIQLLRTRVGSPVSYSSLARDLQCSDKTVKHWLAILESLYVVFRVSPYHRNVARAILKAPKYYFYDNGQVAGDQGARLENLIACALLKEIHLREDCFGDCGSLCYLRDKQGKEMDFLVMLNDRPALLVEAKWSQDEPAEGFRRFAAVFPGAQQVQVVAMLKRRQTYPSGLQIRQAGDWLSRFSLHRPEQVAGSAL